MDKWINIEDRLPEFSQDVLCFRPLAHYTEDPKIKISYRRRSMRTSPQGVKHHFACWCHVTHWMPLPESPR